MNSFSNALENINKFLELPDPSSKFSVIGVKISDPKAKKTLMKKIFNLNYPEYDINSSI